MPTHSTEFDDVLDDINEDDRAAITRRLRNQREVPFE
jgi:hypothetical protein